MLRTVVQEALILNLQTFFFNEKRIRNIAVKVCNFMYSILQKAITKFKEKQHFKAI